MAKDHQRLLRLAEITEDRQGWPKVVDIAIKSPKIAIIIMNIIIINILMIIIIIILMMIIIIIIVIIIIIIINP